jgi:pyruvate/2-oxoglutarate dehydrogenase complex dihydrolipoamide dehydrogenase (E3) component
MLPKFLQTDRWSRKKFQKILAKQGIKFKLSTKVIDAKLNADGMVEVIFEPSAGGSQESVTILLDTFEMISQGATRSL